jgi:hypothetical protein
MLTTQELFQSHFVPVVRFAAQKSSPTIGEHFHRRRTLGCSGEKKLDRQ